MIRYQLRAHDLSDALWGVSHNLRVLRDNPKGGPNEGDPLNIALDFWNDIREIQRNVLSDLKDDPLANDAASALEQVLELLYDITSDVDRIASDEDSRSEYIAALQEGYRGICETCLAELERCASRLAVRSKLAGPQASAVSGAADNSPVDDSALHPDELLILRHLATIRQMQFIYQIATTIRRDKDRVSEMLKRLESVGLVTRDKRRPRFWSISGAGRARAESATAGS